MSHKLLLADDSVTIQRVIELTFADEDVQVVAVGDGEQAIARMRRERPDIVLADIGMPERDGYDVARIRQGARPTSNTFRSCCSPARSSLSTSEGASRSGATACW